MPDVLWSDVSEYQTAVTDAYPYPVLCVRSNDGTYRDTKFATNYAWARTALDTGGLHVLIVYLVYRENWEQTLATTIAMIGDPHPQCAVMLDVESWGGQITGDHSDSINCLFWGLADWIGDPARVIGYGNAHDLDTLWPTKPDGVRLIVAAYGSTPDYPGQLGHQFTDGSVGGPLDVAPFGMADVNSADGYDLHQFCAALGLGMTPADLWNYQLPDPYVAPDGTHGQPKSAADLLGWSATHAAYAVEQVKLLAAAVTGLQIALDSKVQAAVTAALTAGTVDVDVTVHNRIPVP